MSLDKSTTKFITSVLHTYGLIQVSNMLGVALPKIGRLKNLVSALQNRAAWWKYRCELDIDRLLLEVLPDEAEAACGVGDGCDLK